MPITLTAIPTAAAAGPHRVPHAHRRDDEPDLLLRQARGPARRSRTGRSRSVSRNQNAHRRSGVASATGMEVVEHEPLGRGMQEVCEREPGGRPVGLEVAAAEQVDGHAAVATAAAWVTRRSDGSGHSHQSGAKAATIGSK